MVKVRLLQLHQHGSLLFEKGTIIEVDERRAQWMYDNGIAESSGVTLDVGPYGYAVTADRRNEPEPAELVVEDKKKDEEVEISTEDQEAAAEPEPLVLVPDDAGLGGETDIGSGGDAAWDDPDR